MFPTLWGLFVALSDSWLYNTAYYVIYASPFGQAVVFAMALGVASKFIGFIWSISVGRKPQQARKDD